jgi:hypothetical protein
MGGQVGGGVGAVLAYWSDSGQKFTQSRAFISDDTLVAAMNPGSRAVGLPPSSDSL